MLYKLEQMLHTLSSHQILNTSVLFKSLIFLGHFLTTMKFSLTSKRNHKLKIGLSLCTYMYICYFGKVKFRCL